MNALRRFAGSLRAVFGGSFATLWLACAPAWAQTADPDEDQASEPVRDVIVVTGSRLRGIEAGEAWPLTTISRAALEATGQTRLGDVLQQMPFTSGSPLNTRVSQRGQGGGLSRGIEAVELRGLGPERTLVLLNGRRFVPGGNGASGLVDLGMLPLAMVERIEIFKSGASVEYGADALAGVINIITRKHIEGVELSTRGRISRRGDGETFALHALAGRQWGRLSVDGGLEYSNQAALSKGDRGFSSTRLSFEGPENRLVFDGSSAPPGGQFRTSRARLTLIDGRPGTSVDDFRPFIDSGPNTDRFNFNPFEDLQQDAERVTAFGSLRWSASGSFSAFSELFFHQRESSQQLAPLPLFTTRLADVSVAPDNTFNPFGERIFDARRRLVEAGPRTFSQDNETWRIVAGVEGGSNGWFWDAAVSHGRNETDQRKTGDLLADRVRLALGPSERLADGTPVCGAAADPVAGCVPLNLFGGPRSIDQAMLDYVVATLNDTGFNEQTVFNANVAGDLIELQNGPLALALGFESRDERGADLPDRQSRIGNTTGNARTVTRGAFTAREAYLELGVPLLADRFLVRRLDLDLGARRVDFDNFGPKNLGEVGVGWQVAEHLAVRASYSDAFRAPNIGELFGGSSQANPVVLDPCSDFAGLGAVEIERCIAQGVPADGSFDQSGEETPELAGGNPLLDPEQGKILTLGLSWEPLGHSDLRFRLDYFDIEIDSGIGALGAETVLGQCLATGADPFCDAISRRADGSIEFIEAQQSNLARETTQGIDLEATWRLSFAGGQLDHRLLLSHVIERELRAFPGAQPLFGEGEYDPDNFGAIPAWQGNYALDWSRGAWSAGYRGQWIDSILERGGEVFPDTVNRVGSVLYHDLRLGWRSRRGWQASVGVDNLTDVQPPLLVNADEGNTDLGTYRALGTVFWLQLGITLP
ncbi:TonB-dependent receptor domain-containing protein [Wenzhouxiangella limi]|uniref:TonB-dependent receptor n=1 Tax=Wenzhouxiangella limi TaxID=2707351 RepID=A0A845UXD2_9GAMM|nr:TonB-dependent receptor [Wenzhouxiangella limi]NDY96523.1 TonB-dependent receptor [Wenzhouxiangella limi]